MLHVYRVNYARYLPFFLYIARAEEVEKNENARTSRRLQLYIVEPIKSRRARTVIYMYIYLAFIHTEKNIHFYETTPQILSAYALYSDINVYIGLILWCHHFLFSSV